MVVLLLLLWLRIKVPAGLSFLTRGVEVVVWCSCLGYYLQPIELDMDCSLCFFWEMECGVDRIG